MLETMASWFRASAGCVPIPFYFLELLVGLVQALVFMLLTAVFTLLICQHEEAASGRRTTETASRPLDRWARDRCREATREKVHDGR